MPEIVEAGSIQLDKAATPQIVEAGSVQLDPPDTRIPVRQLGEPDNRAMRIFEPAQEPERPYGGELSISTEEPRSGILQSLDNLLANHAEANARSAVAYSLSKELNMRPSEAEDDLLSLTRKYGTRDYLPTLREMGEAGMEAGAAYLALSHPVTALIGIPAFMGLSSLTQAVQERIHGRKGEGIEGFVPSASQGTKDVLWLAEQVAEAYALSPVFKTAKGIDANFRASVLSKWFKDVSEVFTPEKKLFISAGKIRNYFGGGAVGEQITPAEYDVIGALGIPRAEYRAAIKHGLDVEIPAERIVTATDKPWWNQVKGAFRMNPRLEQYTDAGEPIPETTITRTGGGGPTSQLHVSGLLGAPVEEAPRRSMSEIFRDINTNLGDRGSVTGEYTPEQAQAAERLKGDVEEIKTRAQEAGQEFTAFMRESGYDQPTIVAVGSAFYKQEGDAAGVQFQGFYDTGKRLLPTFLDPETKGNISPKPGESVADAVVRKRAEFAQYAEKGVANAPEPAMINETAARRISAQLNERRVALGPPQSSFDFEAPNEEIPASAGKDNSSPGADAGRQAGSPVPVDQATYASTAPVSSVLPVVENRTVASWTFWKPTLDSSAEVAEFARDNLINEPQEQALLVMVDAANKPVAVLRHTIGAPHQSIVFPGLLSGSALDVPGAVKAYFVHQHPSGNPTLSNADLEIDKRMRSLLRGTAIKYGGFFAVGDTAYSEAGVASGESPLKTFKGGDLVETPVQERKFSVRKSGLPHITGPEDLVKWVADANIPTDQPLIIVMDAQNYPLDVIRVKGSLDRLRAAGTHEEVLKLVHKRNAVSLLVYAPDSDLKRFDAYGPTANVAKFASTAGLTLLDVLDKNGSKGSSSPSATFTEFYDITSILTPEFWQKNLAPWKDSYAKARPHLENLGRRLRDSGETSFWSWKERMQEFLGDLWDTFKGKMAEIWEVIKKPLANQRGAVGDIEAQLKRDFEALKKEAEAKGMDVATYMAESGLDAESINEMLRIGGDRTNVPRETFSAPDPVSDEDVNMMLDMAARMDEPKAIEPGMAYEAIKAEAARRAEENVTSRHLKEKLHADRVMRRLAVEAARQTPVQAAMADAISQGGIEYESIRVDYSQDTIKELNRRRPGLVSHEGKARLDEIAAAHGFEDGDVLVEDILRADTIGATADRLVGDMEAQIAEQMAKEVDKSSYVLEVIEEEAKILRELMGSNAPKPATGLKAVIRKETGQVKVNDIMVSSYDALKAGLRRAEIASRIAYREGNVWGALQEKIKQADIARRYQERMQAKEEINKAHDAILAISQNKDIPLDYQDQIATLLEGYDLLPRSSRGQRRMESLRAFLERAEIDGENVDIPRALLDRMERYEKIHWRDLTLEELRDILDQATMIEHLGKLKGELLERAKERRYETAVAGIVDTIKKNFPITDEDLQARIDRIVQNRFTGFGWWETIKTEKEEYSKELIKPEYIFRLLDKWQDLGPVWTELYGPIKQASDAGIRLRQEILPKLEKLFEPFTEKSGYRWKNEKTFIPEINKTMTKEEIVMVALNTGNAGNLDALAGGYGWTEEQIGAIVKHLTPEEKGLVRGIWDLMETLWPHLSQVYERMTGARLRKVDGDYFPLMFDRKLSWIADKNAMEKDLKDFFQSYYATRQPESGFTKERQGGKLPPLLEFDVIFKHIADVTHYVTHVEAIRDVQKLLKDPRIRASIESVPDLGEEGYRQLLPWLQDVARPRIEPLTQVEKLIDYLRRNATVVGLGLKATVAEMQIVAITQSIQELGLGPTMKGIAAFYEHPFENAEFVKGLSAEMSVRSKAWDRELRDAYGQLGLEYFKHSQFVKDSFFGLISSLDMAVAYPTWMAAYDVGMAKFTDQAKAVEFADMSVRKSQAVALVKDFAAVQRGGSLKKMVTMFYTFLSGLHNQLWEMHEKWRHADARIPATLDLVAAYWWLVIFPAAVIYALRERQLPQPKTLAKEVISYRLSTYPFIRDMASPWFNNYDYQISPVERAGQLQAKFAREAGRLFTDYDRFSAERFALYGVEASGYFFPGGLPSSQARITLKGYLDLKAGKTSDVSRLLFRELRPEKEKD